MSDGIVIIGSGFAARQLVKNIRKFDVEMPLTMIAADSIDEYNKPDLSHVMSNNQRAEDMTRQRAGEFAEQFNVRLFPKIWVTDIDPVQRIVKSRDRQWRYDSLVLATGSSALLPPVPGHELMLTLNSQDEYRAAESRLRKAQRVLILGGGLIGCELAMDFCRAGKQVTLVDNSASLLSSLMPPEVSARLQRRLSEMGVEIILSQQLAALQRDGDVLTAVLANGRRIEADEAIAAIGLRAGTALAQHAGLTVNRGIVVDGALGTSHEHIYALGDCAEINGQLMPFLQPIQLSAMTLAKNLTGQQARLTLPPMLVKIKTPELPLQLAGETRRADLNWQILAGPQGLVAKGYDSEQQLRAFVVSEEQMPQAFTLLRELVQ
ncbi:NADH:flavorubredoxin reductase NorW [Enterobacteriaceae bacterium YMB-R22]|jgi:nitric oxide reductase FlRd-NAD(+) reductase|uniref:NADH:flavorubredoxin reductase NorW n=1 Tax=Tenebrionicola larvae TaxID=2815733 RepID=UPI0020113A2B|nr:NADH:flavorubredoxin reductase NorW [Tenebrionicola larvae]MBV4411619.1 NADH:flavorubredoxin reductase NorW [Tenebrionicola larvae]